MRIPFAIVFALFTCLQILQAVTVESDVDLSHRTSNIAADIPSVKVFGHHLFNGSFSQNRQFRYDPDYRVNIGDTINLKLWGAFDLAVQLTVDSQGNIFIPKVGTVSIAGIRNATLSSQIQLEVNQVYKSNVFVYADLASYQPVSVFVTGAVNKPGLYEGLASDSILQFLDKASGIDALSGSYRHISILRNNKRVKTIDLYRFLVDGTLDLFQFRMGDVVVVGSVARYIDVIGDVKRPYRYELLAPTISLAELMRIALPNPTATNAIVTQWKQDNTQQVMIYRLMDQGDVNLSSGASVELIPDHSPKAIEIAVEGEHENVHKLIVDKGTSLKSILDQIHMSSLSDPAAFQLFRKSVARDQKRLINAELDDLEKKIMTTGSVTTEEAIIRKQEAALVMNFIDRARQVDPKGQVIINRETNLSQIMLEDGDTIYIPKKSHMVIVQGEVMLPRAQTYVTSMTLNDYIESCGGYTFRADEDNVLVIRQNGQVLRYDSSSFSEPFEMLPGDAVLVLGKVDSKFLQVIKDITQILYQIAIGAAVVINMN